jgi:hypothetical protein
VCKSNSSVPVGPAACSFDRFLHELSKLLPPGWRTALVESRSAPEDTRCYDLQLRDWDYHGLPFHDFDDCKSAWFRPGVGEMYNGSFDLAFLGPCMKNLSTAREEDVRETKPHNISFARRPSSLVRWRPRSDNRR